MSISSLMKVRAMEVLLQCKRQAYAVFLYRWMSYSYHGVPAWIFITSRWNFLTWVKIIYMAKQTKKNQPQNLIVMLIQNLKYEIGDGSSYTVVS